jgi:hypothetical protein
VDEAETRGVDHSSRHPNVRSLGPLVLRGQRVGQVRVEEEIAAVELDEEAALTDPPQVNGTCGRLVDIEQEGIVRERRFDQTPTSSRTVATPRTRFASF